MLTRRCFCRTFVRSERLRRPLSDVDRQGLLRQTRTAGYVKPRCSMPPTPNGRCGPNPTKGVVVEGRDQTPRRRKLVPDKAQNHLGSLLSTNRKPVAGVPMAHDVLGSPAYKTLTLVSEVPM